LRQYYGKTVAKPCIYRYKATRFIVFFRDGVVQLFEAWMPSFAPRMVLPFAETKVRPAAGNGFNTGCCIGFNFIFATGE
jgi:hypothetical protein